MDFTLILRIAAVGLIVAILQQILSKLGRDEYGMLVVLSGIIVILVMLVPQLVELLQAVQNVMPLYCFPSIKPPTNQANALIYGVCADLLAGL